MNVGIMQPTFMPWLGYFELINISDVFIFGDDFQYSTGSFHQRNRIFIKKDMPDWVTVPTKKGSYKKQICHVEIDESMPWRRKLIKTIQHNYSKCEYFNEYIPFIETWLMTKQTLCNMNIDFIKYVCEVLKIKTKFYLSSEHPTESIRSKHIVELLNWKDATCYICARGSFEYMYEDKIFPNNIRVEFQDFRAKSYTQIGSKNNFISHLSVLDALFNIGSKKTLNIIKNGTYHWNTWKEMVSLKIEHEPDILVGGLRKTDEI
jgi:hypothetical protein